jgi:uncharacterized protein YceK
MKKFLIVVVVAFLLNGCTSIITAPIDVASSVVGAGINLVGSAGGAVVNTIKGGDD